MAEPKLLKNGNYRLRLRFKHPFTGKWIERSTTQKTKKLCNEWRTKTLSDALVGVSPDKVKLIPYFDLWYDTYKRNAVGADHLNKIKATKKHISEFFDEDIFLHQIDKVKYQQFINYLGGKDDRNLAKATVRDHHKILKACLVEAHETGLIRTNPSRKATIVGRDTTGEKKKSLNMDEWKKLLCAIQSAEESSSKYAALTMMFTGGRFQEIDGLRISDIDFKNSTIAINKAFDYKRTKDYTTTKNSGSKRVVDMPDVLKEILKAYVSQIKKASKVIGISSQYEEDSFLFPNEVGVPITNAAINKFLTKRCKKAMIDRITSHAFRHAKTDLLVLAGADMIYTQKQLGHADAATTLKYYSELNMDIRVKNKKIQEDFLEEWVL